VLVARGGLLGAGRGSGGAGKPSPRNWALIAHKIYIFTPSRTSRTPEINNYFSFPQSPRRVKKDIYAGWYKGCTVLWINTITISITKLVIKAVFR
jgi:hypothetical protein